MFRIGVVSDTHGLLDARVTEIFAGVDHILHAGDVGRWSVLNELRAIAPVTAVQGNVDGEELGLRLTEFVELDGHGFLIHHILDPRRPSDLLQARITEQKPSAVIFGHTHQQFSEVIRGVRFLNPGSAGQARFGGGRSVATVECDGAKLRVEFHSL